MKIFSILALTAVSASAAVNLIDSTHGIGAGSFELGAYAQNSGNSFNYMRLSTGSTTITGWTVGGPDGVDWQTAPSNPAFDGAYSVDLAGVSHAGTTSSGSISTTIPTVVGMDYLISFVSYILGPDPVTGRLTVGSLDQTFASVGIDDPSDPTYTPFEYTFTALSSSTVITFATTNSAGFGPVIDNVVIVPEPSSALLGLVGISVLMGRSRARNQRGESGPRD